MCSLSFVIRFGTRAQRRHSKSHIFTVPLSTLTFLLSYFKLAYLKDMIHFFCFHLRLGNQTFSQQIFAAFTVYFGKRDGILSLVMIPHTRFLNTCSAKIFQTAVPRKPDLWGLGINMLKTFRFSIAPIKMKNTFLFIQCCTHPSNPHQHAFTG